jgi:hypothetical protein
MKIQKNAFANFVLEFPLPHPTLCAWVCEREHKRLYVARTHWLLRNFTNEHQKPLN